MRTWDESKHPRDTDGKFRKVGLMEGMAKTMLTKVKKILSFAKEIFTKTKKILASVKKMSFTMKNLIKKLI